MNNCVCIIFNFASRVLAMVLYLLLPYIACRMNLKNTYTTSSSRSRLYPHLVSRRALCHVVIARLLTLAVEEPELSQPVIQRSSGIQYATLSVTRPQQNTISCFLLIQSTPGSCCVMTAAATMVSVTSVLTTTWPL